jgi:hypothetical protein
MAGNKRVTLQNRMLTGSVAHDEFGVPLDVIRVDALKAGMILAAVVGGSLLMRRRG